VHHFPRGNVSLGSGVIVFHAGTKLVGNQILTDGGRVFAVAATGETLEEAVATAYEGVNSVRFRNMFYRKDIAYR
jgi:phosphoribosylamine-glycine ligase